MLQLSSLALEWVRYHENTRHRHRIGCGLLPPYRFKLGERANSTPSTAAEQLQRQLRHHIDVEIENKEHSCKSRE